MFLILGVWIAILPYLGFPYSWKNVLFTLTGFVIIGVSYVIYQEHMKDRAGGGSFDNFSENARPKKKFERVEVTREIIEEAPAEEVN